MGLDSLTGPGKVYNIFHPVYHVFRGFWDRQDIIIKWENRVVDDFNSWQSRVSGTAGWQSPQTNDTPGSSGEDTEGVDSDTRLTEGNDET